MLIYRKVKPIIIFQAPSLRRVCVDQGCLPLSLAPALDKVLVLKQSKLDNPPEKQATFEKFYLSGSNYVRAYM